MLYDEATGLDRLLHRGHRDDANLCITVVGMLDRVRGPVKELVEVGRECKVARVTDPAGEQLHFPLLLQYLQREDWAKIKMQDTVAFCNLLQGPNTKQCSELCPDKYSMKAQRPCLSACRGLKKPIKEHTVCDEVQKLESLLRPLVEKPEDEEVVEMLLRSVARLKEPLPRN